MRKKKILLCSEAHYLHTGYAVISDRVLRALNEVPEFEVAEFAAYGKINAPQAQKCPWKFYANAVDDSDPRIKDYNSNELNKFGQWRIDRVLLDYKPDVILMLRDAYMDGPIMFSPLVKYAHTIMHVPVDSAPQKPEWLELYQRANSVFTYSKYGLEILKKECPKANLVDFLGAGVDTDVYKPLDKAANRRKHGIAEDLTIFGTVMRNQVRKLFPDLIAAFSEFWHENTVGQRKNIYLYLHTAHPDLAGWNITSILHEYKIASHVICTYLCRSCGHMFPAVWQDSKAICSRCGRYHGQHPTVQTGITRQQLNEIYNLFDLYIQPATCEGQGFPPLEAAATGCPIACTDFSALSDYLDNLGGYRMKVLKQERDHTNDSYRSIADRDDMVRVMRNFDNLYGPQTTSLDLVKKHYSWSNINKKLIDHIHTIPLSNKWIEDSYRANDIPPSFPPNLPHNKFIDWMYEHVMVGHDRFSFSAKDIECALTLGVQFGNGKKISQITQEKIFNMMVSMMTREQSCEKVRLGVMQLQADDWIQFANRNNK